jgi:putative flippase GtrA
MNSTIVRFYVVGLMGVGVQLAALAGFTRGFGFEYRISTALAVELALIHNFLWHERWTWPGAASEQRLRRLWQFHVSTGAVSIAANVALTSMLADLCRMPHLLANALAILIASVGNYLAADRVVWAAPRN